MIGRQVKIYLHPDDHPVVEEYLRTSLGAVLLAPRWPSPKPVAASGPGPWAMICPSALVPALRPRHVEEQGYWLVDPTPDPVVEWTRSKVDAGYLYPGRFYYVPEHDYHAKDVRFLRTANRLFRWVRETTRWVETGWGRERLGVEAAARVERGELRLRANPPGSRG